MNRLQSELKRLYLVQPQARDGAGEQPSTLTDPSGRVRALVMELTRPPSWEVLSRVWHGVQHDLGLPAPAIAISGSDALQLWFSLAEPIEARRAHTFLAGLRERFLAGIEPSRIRLIPALNASSPEQESQARLVPALHAQTGNWSAFLAPDLVPIFADTPWLDIPPNEEGQATLLQGVGVIGQAVFETVFETLLPSAPPLGSTVAVGTTTAKAPAGGQPETASIGGDPKQFLLRVMNDATAPLALRIEAAKALLQHTDDLRPAPSE